MPTLLEHAGFTDATHAYAALVEDPLYAQLPIDTMVTLVDVQDGCRGCFGHTFVPVSQSRRWDGEVQNVLTTGISRDKASRDGGRWKVDIETTVGGARTVIDGYVRTPAEVTAFFARHLPPELAKLTP